MVQPISYQLPGVSTDPFADVLQGLRIGATLQELDLARAAQQQKLAQQQAAAEQQRLASEALSAYLAKPSGERTLEDARGLVRFLPAEQVKNLTNIDSTLSEEQRRNQVLFAGQVGSALRLGNTDLALQMVRERAEAEKDPQKKQGFQILAQSIEKAPEAALETLRVSTTALGKDYESAAKAMFGAPAGGQMISTPEAKVRAGLVDDKGAPLAGTFFQEPGKEPKLITGAKPEQAPETIRMMRTLNLPITEEGLARFKAIGAKPEQAPETIRMMRTLNLPITEEGLARFKAIGAKPEQAPEAIRVMKELGIPLTPEGFEQYKKRAPLVKVELPGEPTTYEKEIDKKFAPIAVEWMAGEKTSTVANINQLSKVISALESKKRLTGPVVGLTPDVVLAFANPASRSARANAEQVIQRSLRATLGAQFTKPEGEAFLARAYDPKAEQADNVRRLKAIVTQMRESAKDRDAMLKWVQGEGKGSLRGYTGRIPSINDFYTAIEEEPPKETPAVSAAAPAAAPASDIRSRADEILRGGR
jgi:hypothetical protein